VGKELKVQVSDSEKTAILNSLVGIVMSRKLRWVWNMGTRREIRNAYKILVGKLPRKLKVHLFEYLWWIIVAESGTRATLCIRKTPYFQE
jgi:hypothetical protein